MVNLCNSSSIDAIGEEHGEDGNNKAGPDNDNTMYAIPVTSETPEDLEQLSRYQQKLRF